VSSSTVPIEFGNINPTYSSLFTTFSQPKLFTAIHSKFVDVRFFLPSAARRHATPAASARSSPTVDRKRRTQIKYFDERNRPLGKFNVARLAPAMRPCHSSAARFLDDQVGRVRIRSGNRARGQTRIQGGTSS
jgi:hypothetical protein